MIVSFDCFLEQSKLNIFGSSKFLFKVFISSFFPLLLILLFIFLSSVVKCILCKRVLFKWLIVISGLTILFTMYSNTSQIILSLFNCKTIENERLLERDLEIPCWKAIHMWWAFGFSLPLLILFVFGLPILGIVFLWFKWWHLNDPHFMKYFIVMYQGFKNETYYWEFINILRKILLVCIHTIIPVKEVVYKAILGLMLLVGFLWF